MVFLAGGTHTQPMPNLSTVTVEQADALVAQLRNGESGPSSGLRNREISASSPFVKPAR